MIVLNAVINRVRDLSEALLVHGEAELLLLYLDLVSNNKVTRSCLNRPLDDRHNKLLDYVLFLVVDTDLHMSAFVNLVTSKLLICNCFMVGH